MRKILVTFIALALVISVKGQDNRIWSTYYGGTANDVITATTTDSSGNVYIAGWTSSTTAVASGGHQNAYGGGFSDAFLAKFDASGNRIWATYYGGSSTDEGYGLTVDANGNVYLCGSTGSPNAISSGGFQNVYGGADDAFLVKFDSNGIRQWATYYGGSGGEIYPNVTCDFMGNLYLVGTTESTGSIASGGFQNIFGGGTRDAFIVAFHPSGSRLWASYYGGSGEESGYDVSADSGGNIYLAGETTSSALIASGGFQNTFGGTQDCFLVKFDNGGARLWATYYGGSANEFYPGLTTDVSGNIYLAGSTSSTSGIALSGFQNNFGGGSSDVFLVKFDASGNRIWGTYYGGTGAENPGASGRHKLVATDNLSNVYLSSNTLSSTGISSGGFQNASAGSWDAFLVKLNLAGNLICATYYGGSGADFSSSVSVDSNGKIYIAGECTSVSGIASGGFQNVIGGGADGYLVKFDTPCTPSSQPSPISGFISICSGSSNTYSVASDPSATSYTWTLPGGWTGTSTTNSISTIASVTSGNITVTADNACGSSPQQTLAITVNTVPAAPGIISGNTSVCAGSNNTYSVTNDTSALSYTWSLPGGWTGTSTTSSINATVSSVSGNITVTANNSCGSSAQQTLAVTVNALPNVSVTLPLDTLCVNSAAVTLSGGSPSGGVYSGTNVSAGSFNPASTGNFLITYTVTDTNSCTDSATATIVVDACLGINENEADLFSVYPNPTNGMVSITSQATTGQVTIYNATGEMICVQSLTSGKTDIDLSHCADGIYFVQVQVGSAIITKKIIKE